MGFVTSRPRPCRGQLVNLGRRASLCSTVQYFVTLTPLSVQGLWMGPLSFGWPLHHALSLYRVQRASILTASTYRMANAAGGCPISRRVTQGIISGIIVGRPGG